MFNLSNLATIKNILSKSKLAPNKFMGQNFLIDQNVLDKIIETANLQSGDNVLEIGPGLGTLTAALCVHGANVVAVEKDKELIPLLEENLGMDEKAFQEDLKRSEPKHSRSHGGSLFPPMHSRIFSLASGSNFTIINDDFLQVDFARINAAFSESSKAAIARSETTKQSKAKSEIASLPSVARNDRRDDSMGLQYKVVSNIPYYITSPVLRKILSAKVKPTEIILLVQREVAERIAAPAGEMSLISLYVQFHGTPSVVQVVKPDSFWPAPKVESAILKIAVGVKFELPLAEEEELWHLAKIGFSSRRKTLANNLAAGFHRKNSEIKEMLKKAGFRENARAQELSVEKWIELVKAMKKMK